MRYLRKLVSYIKSVIVEMRRVNFPSRQQTITRTLVVIVSLIIATLFIAAVDFGLAQAMKLLVL